jgi:hypothetical protein
MRITDVVASAEWTTWLTNALRPVAASTAENASSTGSPAATRAPNATSRIASVSGSEVYSARLMSSANALFIE